MSGQWAMRRPMAATFASLLVLVTWLGVCTGAATAQSSGLPGDLYPKTNISPDDRAIIRAFISDEIATMLNGEPAEIVNARKRLEGVFAAMPANQASRVFRQAYSEELGRAIANALGQGSIVADVNLMIVASRLEHRVVIDVARAALGHENPAVRYRGAKAVFEIARRDAALLNAEERTLTAEDYQSLLNLLRGEVPEEDDAFVRGMGLKAIAQLPIPEANLEALRVVNALIDEAVNQLRRSLAGELEVLQIVAQKLARDLPQRGAEAVMPSCREMGKAASRFMIAISRQLAAMDDVQAGLTEAQFEEKKLLLRKCEETLRWLGDRISGLARQDLPSPISNAIETRLWDEIELRAQDWIDRVLRQPPLSIPQDQFDVAEPN